MNFVKNPVKEKIRAGVPAVGMLVHWPSPEIVEISAHLGFDWVWIDLEHGTFDPYMMSHVNRAAEAAGIVSIARIPKTSQRSQILAYMETGFKGVLAAHTESRDDVQFIVDAVKYPPVGKRSAGAMRGAKWGLAASSADYYETSNQETLVMALVEEPVGIENIEEIVSVPELDAVMIGPGDLSLNLGLPGQINHPDTVRLREKAEAAVLKAGKALMVITYADLELGKQAVTERKALLPVCSSQGLLVGAARTYLETVKQAADAR